MGSEFANDSGYVYATPGDCWVLWAALVFLIVLGLGAVIGWRAAEHQAKSRRQRFKASVRSSVDKALEDALKARDEEFIVAAKKLVAEVNQQLEPVLNLSDHILANRKALDSAVRGKAKATDPPHTAGEPVKLASGAVGVGVMAPVQIVSVSPPHSAPHEGSAERDMSVPERDAAVRKAVLAFETFWKTTDVGGMIQSAQQTLLGERAP
jgi:hypothetical protein